MSDTPFENYCSGFIFKKDYLRSMSNASNNTSTFVPGDSGMLSRGLAHCLIAFFLAMVQGGNEGYTSSLFLYLGKYCFRHWIISFCEEKQ